MEETARGGDGVPRRAGKYCLLHGRKVPFTMDAGAIQYAFFRRPGAIFGLCKARVGRIGSPLPIVRPVHEIAYHCLPQWMILP
jgi:hypothetical protein